MNSTTTRSFGWSLALHVSCCIALLVVVARPIQEITPAITARDIFRLVPYSESVSQSGPSGDLAPTVRMPELPRIKILPVPEEIQQSPAPQTVNSTPRTNTPTVSSGSQRVSFDQYQRLHGLLTSSSRKPSTATTSNSRRINAGDFAYNGPSATNHSAATPASSSELSENFISGLLSELKRSYADREAGLAGLSVEVEFTLGADGRLKTSRLLTSSGQTEFDQAVLDALQRVQLANCPPDAVGCRFKTKFIVPNL